MALVLLIAAGFLVLGHFMGASRVVQGSLLAVLFGAVILIQIGLPAGHPLRAATGGSLQAWLIFAAVAGLAAAYILVLKRLKSRAVKPETPTQDGPFSDGELERYARHFVMREIGGAGQQRLKKARVLVIGAGGLGSPALLYLAAAGIGTIGVVDDDEVSLSNMQRQILHAMDRIGMPKVFSAQQGLAAINPHVEVLPYNRRLDADNAKDLFEDFDLVLDGSDNFATRHLVNETCVALGLPLISAAITQWEGQISLYHPAGGAPCYACVFPEIPAEGLAPSCAEAGVMGALPGVVGSMMAVETIKHITGAGPTLKGELLIYDALYGESRKMRMERRKGCKICGGAASPQQ
jgi:sulfur-carrier protein adenylyltransferase/sulfurtransferase